MRVTDQRRYTQLVDRIRTQQSRLQKSIDEVSSGEKFTKPSDNPAASALVRRLQESTARHEGYLNVATRMQGEYEMAESSIAEASTAMQRALDVAMQMSNGTYSDENLKAAAEEVAQIFEMVRQSANSQYQGRYIFGGVKEGTPPVDAAGVFQGSTDLRTTLVGDHASVSQMSGADLFGGAGGATNPMTALSELRTALNAGDRSALGGLVDRIRSSVTQLNLGRQRTGHVLQTIEHARGFADNVVFQNAADTDRAQSADIAQAASRIQLISTSLQATTEAASRLRNLESILKL